ncbi:helix-turn-helix domain-containing protein [Rhodococcus hoagii]|nr:helix-turn-helix domain-containing protein [Prescottella equi]NKV87463.1 helix-turn-helix domain-containing protein [Prescottella equi]
MKLLKTVEVAEFARCHPVTVRRAAAAGELRGMQRKAPQGEWRFKLSDVESWLRGE